MTKERKKWRKEKEMQQIEAQREAERIVRELLKRRNNIRKKQRKEKEREQIEAVREAEQIEEQKQEEAERIKKKAEREKELHSKALEKLLRKKRWRGKIRKDKKLKLLNVLNNG